MCGFFNDRCGRQRVGKYRLCRNCSFYLPSIEARQSAYCTNKIRSARLVLKMKEIKLCSETN